MIQVPFTASLEAVEEDVWEWFVGKARQEGRTYKDQLAFILKEAKERDEHPFPVPPLRYP